MTAYAKYVYPLVEVGKSHARPLMPEAFIKVHEISVTWDIYSTVEADRCEYWEVDEGGDCSNLTLIDAAAVELAVYGPAGKAQWLIDNPPPDP